MPAPGQNERERKVRIALEGVHAMGIALGRNPNLTPDEVNILQFPVIELALAFLMEGQP